MKIDNCKEQIILDEYFKNKSKKEISKLVGCSTWKIRQILKNTPARYHCETCSSSLTKHNTRFCSKKCFYEDKRKYKTCIICNAKIHGGTRQIKYCNECSASLTIQTSNELIKKRRTIILELKGNQCTICKYSKCTSALHFHHRNPNEKKFSLSGNGLAGHTWESIMLEVVKCDLLCANCHIEEEERLKLQIS